MPNYDTYKIYFTKNLSKNQEKIKKKWESFKPPTFFLSLLIIREITNSKNQTFKTEFRIIFT